MNIKLSEYARRYGVTYRTAWNRYKAGKIKGEVDENGNISIPITPVIQNGVKRAVLYSRVSNSEAKSNLERQAERLAGFATTNGFVVEKEVSEIGSGMNDARPKLMKLLTSNDEWDTLIVENRDRLTRFGYNYIEALLMKMGKEILVVNPNRDDRSDLMQDLISIVYSFSARIYGLRRAKGKQQEILDAIKD